jgi:dihydroflavonol-4-reductase
MSMRDLVRKIEQISGIAAPRWNVPLPLLYAMAAANEVWAGITKRPALISLAAVRLMGQERDRTRFNQEKSERELGIQFRPVEQTLSETIRWYQQNGWLKTPELKKVPLLVAGQRS